jgi:cytochrome c biogenesis protein CcmG, thiol:disulfide interchange protein DsbE
VANATTSTTAASGVDGPPRPRFNTRVLVMGAVVVLPLLVILVLNIDRNPHSVRSPLVGREAPPFSLVPVGGGPSVSLESLRGRPAVLNFWATWCVPCFQEHAALTSAARTMGHDVQFLGIVYQDEEEGIQAYLRRQGQAYPSLMDSDGKVAIAYGVFGVPETYFIDGNGRITDKYVGPLDPPTIATLVARASQP